MEIANVRVRGSRVRALVLCPVSFSPIEPEIFHAGTTCDWLHRNIHSRWIVSDSNQTSAQEQTKSKIGRISKLYEGALWKVLDQM